MIKLLFLTSNLFFAGIGYGQKVELGGSLIFGHKSCYQEQGVTIVSRFFKHYDAEFGLSHGRFNGTGFCYSFRYFPLKTKISPFLGFQYSHNFGQSEISLHNGANYTNFKIPQSEFYYLNAGFSINLINREELVPSTTNSSFIFNFSYRASPSSNNKAIYLNGYNPYYDEAYLNKRIGDGFGFSIGLLFVIGLKKHENLAQ